MTNFSSLTKRLNRIYFDDIPAYGLSKSEKEQIKDLIKGKYKLNCRISENPYFTIKTAKYELNIVTDTKNTITFTCKDNLNKIVYRNVELRKDIEIGIKSFYDTVNGKL